MKLLNTLRIILFPILFPLSIVYGAVAFLIKKLSINKYRSKNFVVSVGNVQAGGTGKSPFVMELSKHLIEKKINVCVIFKSYKASLKHPKEVFKDDDPQTVGDEALLCKQSNPNLRIFSGPKKFENIKFADRVKNFDGVYIVDDGAQHHKIEKDYKIILWDFSRFFLDLFPFPLGRAREFWFLTDAAEKHFSSKFKSQRNNCFCDNIKYLNFEIKTIENPVNLKTINKDYTLISGVGHFKELKEKVLSFTTNLKMIDSIAESDHSDFKKFKPKTGKIYVCTEKDHVKLKNIIDKDCLYVVRSEFSKDSIKEIKKTADEIYKLCSNLNNNLGDQ